MHVNRRHVPRLRGHEGRPETLKHAHGKHGTCHLAFLLRDHLYQTHSPKIRGFPRKFSPKIFLVPFASRGVKSAEVD
jgi:hypothetical protein